MNQEQKRIEIAQVCFPQFPVFRNQHGELRHRYRFGDGPVADYLNDLNAMHDAEKVLQANCKYWPNYIDELSKLFRCGFIQPEATNWSQMCHATAAQRAEAFLHTPGLWEPHPAPVDAGHVAPLT